MRSELSHWKTIEGSREVKAWQEVPAFNLCHAMKYCLHEEVAPTSQHRVHGREHVDATDAVSPGYAHPHVPPVAPLLAPAVADDPIGRQEPALVLAGDEVAHHNDRVVEVEAVARLLVVHVGLGGREGG